MYGRIQPVAAFVVGYREPHDYVQQSQRNHAALINEEASGHYVDDFEMRSPIIVERMGIAGGVLKGKKAVGAYWAPVLTASSPL